MRYEKGHKDASRQRILDSAAQRFRKEGMEAVGIASLMQDAGLTHGGFYSHFASKEELTREALQHALDQTHTTLAAAADKGGLRAMIHSYLRAEHRDHSERGCVFAALAAEIARSTQDTRTVATAGLERSVRQIAALLPNGAPATRRKHALGVFAAMVGTLQLARVVADPALAEQILRNGEAAALALAERSWEAGDEASARHSSID